MKVTDTAVIQHRNDAWGELKDGVQVFAGQGAYAIELVAMYGQGWEHYEITISKANTDLDLCDLTQFPADIAQYYSVESVEYYDDRAEAFARVSELTLQKSGF